MSKVWKWIIGILIVLVVAALVVGAVFVVRNNLLYTRSVRAAAPFANGQTRPNFQATPNAPGSPNPNNGQGGQVPYGFNNRRSPMFGEGPMMGGRGFRNFGGFMPFGMFGMGFFFLGGFLRLIVPLGVLALVAFIFYRLGKRAGASSVVVPAPVPSDPTPVDPVETPARGRKVAKS